MALDLDAFGAMLRAARERRGLRAIDLAVAMHWAGTAPVYRYERGGPDAPRPDPDTINLLTRVLGLGYADRMTLLGLAGHLPDTEPLTPGEEDRLLAALGPELGAVREPAFLFDYRGRLLAVNSALAAEFGQPAGIGPAWRGLGVTVFDLVWDPALGMAGRLVEPDAARRFQALRFLLHNQSRRHEAWFRAVPERFGHFPGFVEVWRTAEAQVRETGDVAGLIPVVHAPIPVTLRDGSVERYDISQRIVHGAAGLVALMVISAVPGP